MTGQRNHVAASLASAVFALVGAAGPTAAHTVAPAASKVSGDLATLSAPGWYQVPIDHPTPGNYPLPAALMLGTSGGPGPVIDVGQAQAVVAALWHLRDVAFQMGSNTLAGRRLMAEFESGPALESDEVTCGCTYRTVRAPMSAESLLVTRQATYPATFLAEATTSLAGSAYVQYLIISRTSGSQPWKVVSDPGYLGHGTLDQPGAVIDGLDTSTPPARLAGPSRSSWLLTGRRGLLPGTCRPVLTSRPASGRHRRVPKWRTHRTGPSDISTG